MDDYVAKPFSSRDLQQVLRPVAVTEGAAMLLTPLDRLCGRRSSRALASREFEQTRPAGGEPSECFKQVCCDR